MHPDTGAMRGCLSRTMGSSASARLLMKKINRRGSRLAKSGYQNIDEQFENKNKAYVSTDAQVKPTRRGLGSQTGQGRTLKPRSNMCFYVEEQAIAYSQLSSNIQI